MNAHDTIGPYMRNLDFFFTRYGKIWPCYICAKKFFLSEIATSSCGHFICGECYNLKMIEYNSLTDFKCGICNEETTGMKLFDVETRLKIRDFDPFNNGIIRATKVPKFTVH